MKAVCRKCLCSSCIVIVFLVGCSPFGKLLDYSDYDKEVVAGITKLYDLAPNEKDAAYVYFHSDIQSDLGFKYHRFSLATGFDGELLPGAGERDIGSYTGLNRVDGYQALRVPTGKHSIDLCYVSVQTSGLGGGYFCGGVWRNFSFKKDEIYRVKAESNLFWVEDDGSSEVIICPKKF